MGWLDLVGQDEEESMAVAADLLCLLIVELFI